MNEEINSLIKKLLNKNDVGDRQLKTRKQLKNDFFRDFILDKCDYKCSECGTDGLEKHTTRKGEEISNPLNIHHKDYDWECPHYLTKKTGAKKGMNSIVISNCNLCYKTDRKRFDKCVKKCIILCSICHYKKHWKNKRETGDWILMK